uniref:Uncharacterized protein n=1 Tax=Oryza rufipogon TaxID=4529 RepID=A0A0E0PZ75_ORYRU
MLNLGQGYLHLAALIGHRLPSQSNTSFFYTLHPSHIVLGQARLSSEFFGDRFPEKKLQLVDMSILLILLSPGSGCHIHPLATVVAAARFASGCLTAAALLQTALSFEDANSEPPLSSRCQILVMPRKG